MCMKFMWKDYLKFVEMFFLTFKEILRVFFYESNNFKLYDISYMKVSLDFTYLGNFWSQFSVFLMCYDISHEVIFMLKVTLNCTNLSYSIIRRFLTMNIYNIGSTSRKVSFVPAFSLVSSFVLRFFIVSLYFFYFFLVVYRPTGF